jgi:hypothetical protein
MNSSKAAVAKRIPAPYMGGSSRLLSRTATKLEPPNRTANAKATSVLGAGPERDKT